MTTKRNELKKLDGGKFYTVIHSGNPEYASELKRSTDLTEEEYECVARVLDEDMRIKEQIAYTRKVFGKTAFIDFDIE